jgi:hypothetical protein
VSRVVVVKDGVWSGVMGDTASLAGAEQLVCSLTAVLGLTCSLSTSHKQRQNYIRRILHNKMDGRMNERNRMNERTNRRWRVSVLHIVLDALRCTLCPPLLALSGAFLFLEGGCVSSLVSASAIESSEGLAEAHTPTGPAVEPDSTSLILVYED